MLDGVTLKFFAEHGKTLTDPGMKKLMQRLADTKPVQTLTGDELCKNYPLSKYRGRHGAEDETYDSIMRDIEQADTTRTDLHGDIGMAALAGKDRQVQIMLKMLARNSGASVITIRNRWDVLFGIPLHDAIKEVRKVAPSLRNFYCSFCRSDMMQSKQGTNVVQYG